MGKSSTSDARWALRTQACPELVLEPSPVTPPAMRCAWDEMLTGWGMSPAEIGCSLIRIYSLGGSAVICIIFTTWLSQEMVIFVWSLEPQLKVLGEEGDQFVNTPINPIVTEVGNFWFTP